MAVLLDPGPEFGRLADLISQPSLNGDEVIQPDIWQLIRLGRSGAMQLDA